LKEEVENSRKRKREDSSTNSPVKSPAAKRQKEKHETPAFTMIKVLEDLTIKPLVRVFITVINPLLIPMHYTCLILSRTFIKVLITHCYFVTC